MVSVTVDFDLLVPATHHVMYPAKCQPLAILLFVLEVPGHGRFPKNSRWMVLLTW
jgi:hypothetical protein